MDKLSTVESSISKAVILFIVVLMYKVVTNTYYFFRIKHLSKMHLEWLAGKAPKFPTYKSEVISLFKKAGIKNISIPTAHSLGYGSIASFNADIFTNFPGTNPDISGGAIRMFYEAEGTYRQRIFETLSPVYWIDSIVFAPRNLLSYLGFNQEKALFKACNIMLTFIWWLFGTTILLFRTEFKEFIIELLRKL